MSSATTHFIVIPEGEKRKEQKAFFFFQKAENFPNLGKEIDNQFQEAQSSKRSTPRNIKIKWQKLKENLENGKRKTTSIIKRNPYKVTRQFFN